ncbi:MAG: [protein-PII] uridylyltransferase [Planctomycetaceae bacterium]
MPSPFEARRASVQALRDQCRTSLQAGIPGCTIAANYCTQVEDLLRDFILESAKTWKGTDVDVLKKEGAIIAVGGTGRGELAPYSDIDLLIVPRVSGSEFEEFAAHFVLYASDAGLKFGASTRNPAEAMQFALKDPQAATALVEARPFWGDPKVTAAVIKNFKSTIVDARRRQFIEDCLSARQITDDNTVPMAQELQPDVKSSVGCLRDLHLIRWIGYARYGVPDIESLRLRGALTKEDARKINDTWEFLTRIRIDLHLAAGKPQDRLTRDEQQRIATERGIEGTESQRPVERFMQQFFYRSMELTEITRRFAAVQRPVSFYEMTRNLLVGHSTEGLFHVGPDRVSIARGKQAFVTSSLENVLKLFRTSALYGVPPEAKVLEAVKQSVADMDQTLTPAACRIFLDIMRCTKPLSMVLRAMATTGVLDLIIPDYSHIRNLLQFNQYHHFTVDEHTLRAIETVTSFEDDDGPLGAAYAAVQSKEVLHLAVLLHDIGKGFERDHSELGAEIGIRISERLGMPRHQREQIELLVLKHLVMADVAWRRDFTDEKELVDFSRDCGSPDTLRMLYVLTAADVTSVGPGTWTSWKGNLLAELCDRSMIILSGKRYSYAESERVKEAKQRVSEDLRRQPKVIGSDSQEFDIPLDPAWIDHQLEGCSAYYLTCTPPKQIAADLRCIAALDEKTVTVVADWDETTSTMEYRVITRNPEASDGSFHRMVGVLTAKRHSILSADINTTRGGVVVDSYRVRDDDYTGEPPEERIEDVAKALRSILSGKQTIHELFQRGRRFGSICKLDWSELKTRVRVDNESSDSRTVVDVFSADRPGLLYVIARTLYELGLSVDLAKISTHFDQVIDVFYVQERATGQKVNAEGRLTEIRERLQTVLTEFEQDPNFEF